MDLLRSLPLGLYLEQPVTWLHTLDSRVKFIWLMSFLFAPLVDNAFWRLGIVLLLILLTLSAAIPWRVWRNQMGWLLVLATCIFIVSAIAPDGLGISPMPRLPEATALAQPTNYHYVLWQAGPATVTRRSFDLAVRVSTLLFTLIYSTNLFLLTTAPEEITAGLESMMRPLRRFNWPITEITLTLTLSLRFIPLVLEEVQNLVRSVRTRAINWKKLGIRKSLQIWLMVSERLLENLLLRADQIASAMTVRGFTSPSEHRVQWHQLRLHKGDWVAIITLVVFWGIGLGWGVMA